MIRAVFVLNLAIVLLGSTTVLAKGSGLKAVMQINSANMDVVVRGPRNALDISEVAQTEGQSLDLKLIVFGKAVDLFESPGDAGLRESFQKLSKHSDVHFYVDDRTLKRIHKDLKSLLPGFSSVSSGAYEVLRLQGEGYLYIKP